MRTSRNRPQPPVEIGDPNAKQGSSLGYGGGNTIGNNGCCGGIGNNRPGGEGGAGHPIIPPQLIYKVEPEYTEEARKAKFEGTVILLIDVDTAGKTSNPRVISGLGYGLDEKAVDAVSQWLFRPAFRDGKPFATSARVEVNFRLL